MKFNTLRTLMLTAMAALLISCGDDEDMITPVAGTITGGPFSFFVDGNPDTVSGIAADPNAVGSNSNWVITDDQGNILGLPPDIATLETVDFDGAGVGICFIWYIRYEDGLTGLEVGENTSNLNGSFSLSNSIMVNRSGLDAGTLAGGPFTFLVDGVTDNVSGITVTGNIDAANTGYIVTDDLANILGLPPTMTDLEGVDFDAAGAGVCLIWRITYEDGITGLAAGENANDLSGIFDLSNSITVTRNALDAGTLTGGPFTFTVDGVVDNVSGITFADNTDASNTGWVITDDQGKILGLPPTLTDVEGVDFDGAGAGVCFIYRITYADGLTGLMADANTSDLSGSFDLSNAITVNRLAQDAGTISGGPFSTTVDGIVDNVSGISVSGNNDSSNTGWIITDDQGKILGLPPTLTDVEGVDFDGAGAGVCLIYRITYVDGLTGLAADMNTSGLSGTFDLSNSISVTRSTLDAGTLSGGPFNFTVDGTVDNVSGITVSGNFDSVNTGYIITDNNNKILGLPATLTDVEGVDFDGAGVGVCLIWRITYANDLVGLEADLNTDDLTGTFDLSNAITVNRN